MPKKKLNGKALVVLVLNVGDGDSIVIRFPPAHGPKANGGAARTIGAVVDCYDADKTIDALQKLGITELAFVCATHPHSDHILGLERLIRWALQNGVKVNQFWDSGFRHVSKIHFDLVSFLADPECQDIQFMQPTSGFECVINRVRVRVLSPSIVLKNRYDTFGTSINNASIVLKLEYPAPGIAERASSVSREEALEKGLSRQEVLKQNTIILGGDAQFDAWARITEEYPELVRTQNPMQLIDPRHVHRPLRCQVLKVPHHMSKHGVSLEVLETLRPHYIVASCDNRSRHGFPHPITVLAAEDIKDKKTKDKGIRYTGHPSAEERRGSLLTVVYGDGKRPKVQGLGERKNQKIPW